MTLFICIAYDLIGRHTAFHLKKAFPDGMGFFAARCNVTIPGVDRDTATALAEAAHEICP